MFKIKDLMIKVVPQQNETKDCGTCTAWTGGGCDMGTVCPCSDYSYCTVCTDGCSYVSCVTGTNLARHAAAPMGAVAKGCGTCTAWTGGGCDMGTVCPCSDYSYCTICTDSCSYPSCGSLSNYPTPRVAGNSFRGNLSDLKAALQRQLQSVEEQEKEANESLKPRTLADAEMIEKKLQEALEEIRKMKVELGKGPKK
ncbi:MAG: hypothetical protein ABL888_17410 [Pirellulaceae bacterium]